MPGRRAHATHERMTNTELKLLVMLAEGQLKHSQLLTAITELFATQSETDSSLRRLYLEQSPWASPELAALENQIAESQSKNLAGLRAALTLATASHEFVEAAIEQFKQAMIE